MKRFYFLAFALFALAFASCNEERELDPWEIQMNDIEQKIGDNPAGPEEMAQFMADLKEGLLYLSPFAEDQCIFRDGKCSKQFGEELYPGGRIWRFIGKDGKYRMAHDGWDPLNSKRKLTVTLHDIKIGGENSTEMTFTGKDGSVTAVLEYYKDHEFIIRGLLPCHWLSVEYIIYHAKVLIDPEARATAEALWEEGNALKE